MGVNTFTSRCKVIKKILPPADVTQLQAVGFSCPPVMAPEVLCRGVLGQDIEAQPLLRGCDCVSG